MDADRFRISLYLPAGGSSEVEATVVEWRVAEGAVFSKGDPLAQVDTAKSVFDFEAPCDGTVLRLLCAASDTVALNAPVMEIETSDPAMRDWIPPASDQADPAAVVPAGETAARRGPSSGEDLVILGVGSYLPERVVTNAELVRELPDVSEDYVFQVTGIRERRWAAEGEKPSDMALAAAEQAIADARLKAADIDAIILSTTTPDVAMPSTACILQDRLGLPTVPAFDLNAACSGWLYAVAVAEGLIRTGTARRVLTVAVDLQSRLLDPTDRSAYFIFGDAAGAAVVGVGGPGHVLGQIVLGSDASGLSMARRHASGYEVTDGQADVDPWIRLEGSALFRAAAENFARVIRQALARSGWATDEPRLIVPHQANARILKAAAKRSGIDFDRFYMNVDRVGNTSSASIPLALVEMEADLRPGDKLLLCSVGAGLTTAATTLVW
jgi:3-oxoacyl-[acyl-carrier-protein] synthase III